MISYCNEIQQQMSEDFKHVSEDNETLELAEWGMDDYYDIVISQT